MAQFSEKNDRLPIFRKRLYELMGDMSITEFAGKVGLSRQTMGFYLNGDRIPDAETLLRICEKCNISSDWLLGITNDHNRQPCAVDELGLSNKAVENIRLIRTHSNSAITALDTLLENADILILLEMISQLADSVKDEIQRIKQSADKIEAPILGMDRKTQLSCMDNNRMQRLVEELSNLHPDLRGRIAVFCGDRFLNAQMEDIKSSFECTLHRVTGYYELLSLQMELGRDYGND